MPRDIGPEMLANLERQLSSGDIDVHFYESRRIEVVELIRKNQAFIYSPTEKAARLVAYSLFAVSGLAFLGVIVVNQGNLVGVAIALVLFGFGMAGIGKTLRH